MPDRVNLENLAIVLVRPRISENIGAAARAMQNMGISRLIVVEPQQFDRERVLMMATHAAAGVIEKMQVFADLKEALTPFQFVAGTTARVGGQRPVLKSPEKLAESLIPLSRENRVAVLFGPEDRGLSNEDLRNCHELVHIPTAKFSSLNLAQAVMIVCYEIFRAARDEKTEFVPRLANRHELEGMYAQLKEILVRISFINPDNPDYWMNNLRRFFNRLPLRAREVSIIRGICRQIDWYGGKCYQDGLKSRKDKIKS
ncbi:MAG: RNA methyltransferase [Thermodesulfobacteriota bacterium]